MRQPGVSSKKFSSRVRPGVFAVRASERRPVSALIALDLPAFERPAKAASAPESAGKWLGCAALSNKAAFGIGAHGR